MFIKEALVWRQLRHPYIQPFLGICDSMGPDIGLVSPWMVNGNVIECMRKLDERGETIPCAQWVSSLSVVVNHILTFVS